MIQCYVIKADEFHAYGSTVTTGITAPVYNKDVEKGILISKSVVISSSDWELTIILKSFSSRRSVSRTKGNQRFLYVNLDVPIINYFTAGLLLIYTESFNQSSLTDVTVN